MIFCFHCFSNSLKEGSTFCRRLELIFKGVYMSGELLTTNSVQVPMRVPVETNYGKRFVERFHDATIKRGRGRVPVYNSLTQRVPAMKVPVSQITFAKGGDQ